MYLFWDWWRICHGLLLPNFLKINIYLWKEGAKQLAEEMNVPLLGQIPIVQSICENGDKGTPAALNENSITGRAFIELAENVVKQTEKRNAEQAPTHIVEMKK